MYECLTGAPPFDCDGIVETMYKQINEAPVPLRQVKKDPELTEHLEFVVMKALRKDPKERQQSMKELMMQLVSSSVSAD